MASVSKKHVTAAPPEETVEQVFRRLEKTWLAEVGHLSSSKLLTSHHAFRAIVALGPDVVPFMLRDLEERPRLWVWALAEITGSDPVPTADRGNIAKMGDAWLSWARENGWNW